MFDNNSDIEKTQRSVRPQQVFERGARPEQGPMQMQMAQKQAQAAGRPLTFANRVITISRKMFVLSVAPIFQVLNHIVPIAVVLVAVSFVPLVIP